MVMKFVFLLILALISITYAIQFPLQFNALKADASDEESWVWSSLQRNGRRLKFENDEDDDDFEDDDHDHDDHCQHHNHHHRWPLHFGHIHHHYRGSVQSWRHHPKTYPSVLAPFAQAAPQSVTTTTTKPKSVPATRATERPPAPVFEEPEEVDDRSIQLASITTSKPAYENIDLRFGA